MPNRVAVLSYNVAVEHAARRGFRPGRTARSRGAGRDRAGDAADGPRRPAGVPRRWRRSWNRSDASPAAPASPSSRAGPTQAEHPAGGRFRHGLPGAGGRSDPGGGAPRRAGHRARRQRHRPVAEAGAGDPVGSLRRHGPLLRRPGRRVGQRRAHHDVRHRRAPGQPRLRRPGDVARHPVGPGSRARPDARRQLRQLAAGHGRPERVEVVPAGQLVAARPVPHQVPRGSRPRARRVVRLRHGRPGDAHPRRRTRASRCEPP